ncbi:MAG: hypothetical protein WEB67_11870, partial [Acidimicrobiia bacterium]
RWRALRSRRGGGSRSCATPGEGTIQTVPVHLRHTPLSADEEIPWSSSQLVVGTGASGRLPIMPEIWEEATVRGVELVALPTLEACELLRSIDEGEVCSILHVAC